MRRLISSVVLTMAASPFLAIAQEKGRVQSAAVEPLAFGTIRVGHLDGTAVGHKVRS
jgi:hypothetical protein